MTKRYKNINTANKMLKSFSKDTIWLLSEGIDYFDVFIHTKKGWIPTKTQLLGSESSKIYAPKFEADNLTRILTVTDLEVQVSKRINYPRAELSCSKKVIQFQSQDTG